jgi:hypothetical protein
LPIACDGDLDLSAYRDVAVPIESRIACLLAAIVRRPFQLGLRANHASNPCLKWRARQYLFDVLHDGILGSTDGRSLRRRLRRGAKDDKNQKEEVHGVSMLHQQVRGVAA